MRRSNECSHSRGVTLSDLQTSAAQRKQPLSTGWTSPTPQSRALGDLVWQYLVRRGTSSPSFEYHSTGTPIDYAATTVPPLYDHHEVVALPALPEPISRSAIPRVRVTENWEGVVTEVGDQLFSAKIAPLTRDGPEFIVDIGIDRVDDDDLPLVVPGAPLYLTIGFIPVGVGRKSQLSTVRLRRLPRWTHVDREGWLERARMRRLRTGVYDVEETEEA